MHCRSCEILLSEAIGDTGVKVLSANHSKGEIVVDMSGEDKLHLVKKAVESEGYHLA